VTAGFFSTSRGADDKAKLSEPAKAGRAALARALQLRKMPGQEAAMVEAYREVLKYGKAVPVELRSELELACNNLGVYYLSHNEPGQAAATFANVPEPSGPDAFVFHYNYGRALEKAGGEGSLRKAYDQYWASVAKQPGYARAVDAVARLLLEEKLPRFAEVR